MTNRRITSSGPHILYILFFKKGVSGIFDTYFFRFRNIEGDILELAYKVPAGTIPPKLIRDLLEFNKHKLWAKYNLVEFKNMLVIRSIAEPQMSQQEIMASMPESKNTNKIILAR